MSVEVLLPPSLIANNFTNIGIEANNFEVMKVTGFLGEKKN